MLNVNCFLNPKSVVVVGVSRDKNKVGRLIYDQLLSSQRLVYGVNPKVTKHSKQKIYPTLDSIPTLVDLAIYAVPAEVVLNSVKEAADLGIKNHLIVSSGFGESDALGKEREIELRELVKKYQLHLQGPNCLGNISPSHNFNCSFGYSSQNGNIGFISQSGAMGTAFLDWIAKRNLGISHFISLGNKIDLTENDFLKFLAQDKTTKVIALYLENISQGASFLDLAKKISALKPVVIIKGGQTKEAKMAVTSHTGALAGSFSAQHAAFRQANLLEAQTMEEFFTLVELLSRYAFNLNITDPLIISNAGGPAVLLVDKYAENKVKLLPLSQRQNLAYRKVLPKAASIHNPIDILGDATPKRLESVLNIVKTLNSKSFVQIVLTPQENTNLVAMANYIVKFRADFKGKLVVSMIGGEKPREALDILNHNKIITCEFAENIPHYLAIIKTYQQQKEYLHSQVTLKLKVSSGQKKKLESDILQQQGKGFLSDVIALELARSYQFPLVAARIINYEHELAKVASEIGFPLALKVSSSLIIHRNVVNGVRLNLQNITELEEAYKAVEKLSSQFLVQKMIEHDTEVVVGAKKDPDFGYLLMFGSGGIHADYLTDVSFSVLPLTFQDMQAMIESTKIAKLIKDRSLFWPLFSSLTSMLTDFPQILEVDINPVIVLKEKLYCVDFKVKV